MLFPLLFTPEIVSRSVTGVASRGPGHHVLHRHQGAEDVHVGEGVSVLEPEARQVAFELYYLPNKRPWLPFSCVLKILLFFIYNLNTIDHNPQQP